VEEKSNKSGISWIWILVGFLVFAVLIMGGITLIMQTHYSSATKEQAKVIQALGFDPDTVVEYNVTLVTQAPKIFWNNQWVSLMNKKGDMVCRVLKAGDRVKVSEDDCLRVMPKLATNERPEIVLIVGEGTVASLVKQTAVKNQKEKTPEKKHRLSWFID